MSGYLHRRATIRISPRGKAWIVGETPQSLPRDHVAALAALPPSMPERWVKARKRNVAAAYAIGALTPAEAWQRYKVPEYELQAWVRRYVGAAHA